MTVPVLCFFFFFSFLAADRREKQTDDRQTDRLRVKELFDSIGVP